MDAMAITTWVATGLLGFVYLGAGMMKLLNTEKMRASTPVLGSQPAQKVKLIGGLEVLGVAGILIPQIMGSYLVVAALAAFCLAAIQLFAIPQHKKHNDTKSLPMNIFLFALGVFLGIAHLI